MLLCTLNSVPQLCVLQGRSLKDHVDLYWSDDATFKTPMFTVKGKTDV